MKQKQKSGDARETRDLEVRIDKWLWAARFFKTRRLASEIIQRGKVKLDGVRIKPSKCVRENAEISITQNGLERVYAVLKVSDKRGPAPVAQTLYEETQESKQRKQAHVEDMKLNPTFIQTEGRPNKKNRRLIHQFKQKNQ